MDDPGAEPPISIPPTGASSGLSPIARSTRWSTISRRCASARCGARRLRKRAPSFRRDCPNPAARCPVLDLFERFVEPFATGNGHPAFMGWVHGAGTPVGMLAEMLAAGLNANCGGRDHSRSMSSGRSRAGCGRPSNIPIRRRVCSSREPRWRIFSAC